MTAVAIMQPTFIPWLGYFALMNAVDHFVILDDVQFERRSWQQRNRIKGPEGAIMLTVPVFSKGRRNQLISEVEINYENINWPQKFAAAIKANYVNASHYNDYSAPIGAVLAEKFVRLIDLNMELIAFGRDVLGVTTPISLSSDWDAAGAKGSRLFNICQALGATRYVSPPGSRGYLDQTSEFREAGIPVDYFEYQHPAYKQRFPEFVSHLSFVDALMNLGAAAGELVRKNS